MCKQLFYLFLQLLDVQSMTYDLAIVSDDVIGDGGKAQCLYRLTHQHIAIADVWPWYGITFNDFLCLLFAAIDAHTHHL